MEEEISLSNGEKQKKQNKDESVTWYCSEAFFKFTLSIHAKWVVKSGIFLTLSESGLMPTEFPGLCQGKAASLICILP